MTTPLERDLHLVVDDEPEPEDRPDEEGQVDTDLESLRDEFVDAFNARDLDSLLALVADDVEVPDVHGDGALALGREIADIWERSQGVLLTRGVCDDEPVAVAWLPDDDGSWSRRALVSFAAEDGQLVVIEIVDDADDLERVASEEPDAGEFEQGADWTEWTDGVPPLA